LESFVSQGGGILNFTALVICGNGDGVAGYGKGKSAEVSAAVDKVRSFVHRLIFLHSIHVGQLRCASACQHFLLLPTELVA